MRKMLMVGFIGLATVAAPSVQAASVTDNLGAVLKALLEKGGAYACSQGTTLSFSPKPTLRSFDGILCSRDDIAAITQLACPKLATDFESSKCNKIGKNQLGNRTAESVAVQTLANASPVIKQIACMISKVSPDNVKQILQTACAA